MDYICDWISGIDMLPLVPIIIGAPSLIRDGFFAE